MESKVTLLNVPGGTLRITTEFLPAVGEKAKPRTTKQEFELKAEFDSLSSKVSALLCLEEAKNDVRPLIKRRYDEKAITEEQFNTLREQWKKRVEFLRDWMQSTKP